MAMIINPSQAQGDEKSMQAALEVQEYLHARLKPTTTTKTSPPSFRSIPIIDLTPSFSSSLSARQSVAHQIHEACTTIGFFYITGHGIPSTVCSDVLTLARRFFHEVSQASKDALHVKHNNYFRGYEPAAFTSVNGFESTETKEAFNWGYEAGLDPTGGDGKYVELDGSVPTGTVNQWPDESELPGFYEGIKRYYGEVLQLSRHLFRLFALSLSLPETYFDALMTHPGGIARLIRYPPATHPKPLAELNAAEQEIGLGAHTDYECFTLLLQDATPGLEVLSPDNHWIAAAPVENGIVVNVADFLMRWTNGVYKSTVHRVVNRTEKERFSIPLFFSVNYDEVVETLPGCVRTGDGEDGEGERYPPITAGKYVLDRLNLTVKKTGVY